MIARWSIRFLLAAALLSAAGCATPGPLEQIPISQHDVDAFLASGKDARNFGITIYQDAAGARFEFANRVHQDRGAQMDFNSPRDLPVPVIKARTGTFVHFNLLLDSSARQNWLLLQSVEAMDYRTFAPPTGEYADHIVSEVPGYAGVGNKIVLDALHVESPIFYVPPAAGNLGPLARVEREAENEEEALARHALGARTHAVMGAALMRSFAYVRFDFLARSIRFSSHSTYQPANPAAVVASLPLRDWRGRPAVQATLDGKPLLLVIDTAGDFDLALPGEPAADSGSLALGALQIDAVPLASHAGLGLPEAFPARLGLRFLSRYALVLDHKHQRVWFEDDSTSADVEEDSATAAEEENPPPVQYRGIRP